MKTKISSQKFLLAFVLAGVVFSMIIFLSLLRKSTEHSQNNASAIDTNQFFPTASSTRPARLQIPKIKVDASLEGVGLTLKGVMDVPKNPQNAAWFDRGSVPGEKGNAVISGHFGWKNGIPAVFDDLYKLEKGDKIYVEDTKGTTVTFVVRELRTYDENSDATSVFTSYDGNAHLNLITCEGVWSKVSKSYSQRLVAFTDLEVRK